MSTKHKIPLTQLDLFQPRTVRPRFRELPVPVQQETIRLIVKLLMPASNVQDSKEGSHE